MHQLLKILNLQLSKGYPVASATIATHEGSTPRSAGSKMLLLKDGSMAGTVGGGLVEAQVLDALRSILESGAREVLSFDLTSELAAKADMICGGRLQVFVDHIPATETSLFQKLESLLALGQRCLLLTDREAGERSLITDEQVFGRLLPDDKLHTARTLGVDIQAPVFLEQERERWFLEPWMAADPLIILGAGHVSRPTAQIAALVGFQVTVLDDRPEFANRERFPDVYDVAVLPDFDACLPGQTLTPNTSVVIVTRGHLHDKTVLALILRTNAGYIGMIGSRRKRQAIYDQLLAEGFTQADLDRVHCPIGLSIDAETPEEIAVSIVAELIQSRAKRRKA